MDSYVLFVPEPRIKKQRRSPACAQCRRRKIGCDRGRPMCSNCIRLRRPQCSYPDGEVGYASIAESELRPLSDRGTSNFKYIGSAGSKNSNKKRNENRNSVFQDSITGDMAIIPTEPTGNTSSSNHTDLTAYDPSLVEQSVTNGSTQSIPHTASAFALDTKTSLNSTFSSASGLAVPPSPIPGAETILSFEQLQQLPPVTYQPQELTDLTTESLAESALRTLSSSLSDKEPHTNTKSLPLGTKTVDSIDSREEPHHTNYSHHTSPHNIRQKSKPNADIDTDTDPSLLLSSSSLSSLPVSSKAKIKTLSLEDIANYNTKLRILEFCGLFREDGLGESVSGNSGITNNNNNDNDNNSTNNNIDKGANDANDTGNRKSKKSGDIRKKRDHNEKIRLEAFSREMIFLKRRLDELNRKIASFDESYSSKNSSYNKRTDSNDSHGYWDYSQNEGANLGGTGMKAIEKRRNMSRLTRERRKYISELLSGIPFKIVTLDIQGDPKGASGLGTNFSHDALFTPESLFDKDPFIMKFITSVPPEKLGSENGENDVNDANDDDDNNNDVINTPILWRG